MLAYTLIFALIFLRRFNETSNYPITLTSAVVRSARVHGMPGPSADRAATPARDHRWKTWRLDWSMPRQRTTWNGRRGRRSRRLRDPRQARCVAALWALRPTLTTQHVCTGHSQVAQGFVFFIMLYFLALIKAQSMRYFAFSLLGAPRLFRLSPLRNTN